MSLNTPLMASADPFYVVRDSLQQSIDETRLKYEQWNTKLKTTNTAKEVGFETLHNALITRLQQLNDQMSKLENTVRAVEAKRANFPRIDDAELARRRTFVDQGKAAIAEMYTNMTSKNTAAKLGADKHKVLMEQRQAEITAEPEHNRFQAANEDFIMQQRMQHQEVRKEQDRDLDEISEGVSRLHGAAITINTELTEQEVLLDNLERKVDEAQTSMNVAMKQMAKLLQTKDKCQLWTIVILVVIFVVLLAAVFM